MNRQELLTALRSNLASLPQTEVEKAVAFYDEMIQDRMEDGMTEEEAVAALGSIADIVENCKLEASIPTLMISRISEKKQKSKNKTMFMLALILGFPLWFPLMLTAGVLLFTFYIVAWSLVIALYAVELSFALGSVAGIVVGIIQMVVNAPQHGFWMIGCAFLCASFSILLYVPMKQSSKSLLVMAKSCFKKVKSQIIGKGEKTYA